jgi:hypothetical protein
LVLLLSLTLIDIFKVGKEVCHSTEFLPVQRVGIEEP